MKRRADRAKGFTLITTLFLLVVVSGLAAYLVNLSVAQQTSSAMAVNALRGRHAALSGLEWAAYRIRNVSDTCPPLPSTTVIEGFTIEVTACAATDVTEGLDNHRLFDVTVRAERGSFGDIDYVNLVLRAMLRS